MLPTIQTPAKKLPNPKPRKTRRLSHTIKPELVQERTRNQTNSPFLPLLSEGSLTSFVSSKSSRSQWKESQGYQNMKPGMTKQPKQRGGGFKDYVNHKSTDKSHDNYHTSIAGVKTHDLQLKFKSAMHMNDNKGWSIPNPNPRLLKLQSASGKFDADLTSFHFKNISDYSFFSRTLAAPHVDFLYRHRQTALKEAIISDGTMATLNNRFYCPPFNITENLPELPPPPTRHSPVYPAPASSEHEEISCVHKKACGCHGHRDNIPSRSNYNRWERKPTSLQRVKSLQSNSTSGMVGSKIRVKQAEKPPPSPPKIAQKKSREMSLENLRKKVKKVVNQNSNSHEKLNDKRRRSSLTVTNTKNVRNKRESKLMAATTSDITPKVDANDVNDEADGKGASDGLINVEREVKKTEDTTSEPSDYMNDVLTVVDSVSTTDTPTSIRRLITPRILKINHADGQHADEFLSLRKVFTKLDSDGDGHLSFDELKRSLPSDLTKRQLDYLKKIYVMACESTFFGFEEFVAVNQMCDVIAHVSSSVLKAFESIDVNSIEEKLALYLELFTHLGKQQTGSLDIASFKELVASAMNLRQDNELVTKALSSLGKASNDVVSNVELLVFVPYLVYITPT